jgi:hypothetical protein
VKAVQEVPRYSSYIKDMPYLYLETRKAAKLITGGETAESIVRLSVESNIFQLDKERRRLKLAQKVALRLNAVSRPVTLLIANGNDENARLGVFYAIIKTDLLFYEFIRDVYREKVNIGQTVLTDSEISDFLRSTICEDKRMQAWTENNLVRVKNTYKKILCDAGLIKPDGKELLITKPIINDELKTAWDKPDPYTAAFCLEV